MLFHFLETLTPTIWFVGSGPLRSSLFKRIPRKSLLQSNTTRILSGLWGWIHHDGEYTKNFMLVYQLILRHMLCWRDYPWRQDNIYKTSHPFAISSLDTAISFQPSICCLVSQLQNSWIAVAAGNNHQTLCTLHPLTLEIWCLNFLFMPFDGKFLQKVTDPPSLTHFGIEKWCSAIFPLAWSSAIILLQWNLFW